MAKVEAVLKIGGSLAEHPALESLCREVGRLAKRHRLLVIPGGGPFADAVRRIEASRPLSETAAHKMAILAMDQYGFMLCDVMNEAVPVTFLNDVEPVWESGKVPVVIPSQILFHLDPLPHSWAVTSDSIAAWFAAQMNAGLLILLKDVDGLYRADPKRDRPGELLAEVSLDEMEGCGGVDDCMPAILRKTGVDTWVINGACPERVLELMTRGLTRGTHIRRT